MKLRRESGRPRSMRPSLIHHGLLLLFLSPVIVLFVPSTYRHSFANKRIATATSSFITTSIPRHHDRLLHPWLILPYVRPPSLIESGFRLLHSPLTERCTAGLGHAFTVVNAEISTSLLLHASYSHRSTRFSTIPTNPDKLFNWGEGFLPRSEVGNRYCHLSANSEPCPVCDAISDEGRLLFHNIVVVPLELSYGCVSCHLNIKKVREFLDKHGRNHTLFQMHPARCKSLPKSPDFTLSRPFFYSQYWKAAPVSSLSEANLNIVIHARRGDFFMHSNRRMTSLRVFARLVEIALEVVKDVGDVFAQMPIKLLLFSEGRSLKGSAPHDMSSMDNQFVDSDKEPRHAGHLYELLVGEAAYPEQIRTPHCSAKFPHGLSVEFRIATAIADTVRCMAAADIFVGSASDLSEYSIRVVSRAGLQLIPDYLGFVSGCCAVKFWKDGFIKERDLQLMKEYWTSFVSSNRASAMRAVGL